jgi:hypothetical protein
MSGNLQVSARSLVSLLASIFGPSIYDAPPFGRGDLGRRGLLDLISGPQPDPWRAVALNPQPLPPKALYAVALADKYIEEVLALDRVGALLGGEVMERAQDRALCLIAEIDELCPRWPKWPKVWPPPPPPPWEAEEMSPTELLLYGARLLAASGLMEQERLQLALADLGEKALDLSLNR